MGVHTKINEVGSHFGLRANGTFRCTGCFRPSARSVLSVQNKVYIKLKKIFAVSPADTSIFIKPGIRLTFQDERIK